MCVEDGGGCALLSFHVYIHDDGSDPRNSTISTITAARGDLTQREGIVRTHLLNEFFVVSAHCLVIVCANAN